MKSDFDKISEGKKSWKDNTQSEEYKNAQYEIRPPNYECINIGPEPKVEK